MSKCEITGPQLVPRGRNDPRGPDIMSIAWWYMQTFRASLSNTDLGGSPGTLVAQGEREGERKGPGECRQPKGLN